VTKPEEWRHLAIDAYHLLCLAEKFKAPPDYFGWSSERTIEAFNKLEYAVRADGRDMFLNEARLEILVPYCTECKTAACVSGQRCCRNALKADAFWDVRGFEG